MHGGCSVNVSCLSTFPGPRSPTERVGRICHNETKALLNFPGVNLHLFQWLWSLLSLHSCIGHLICAPLSTETPPRDWEWGERRGGEPYLGNVTETNPPMPSKQIWCRSNDLGVRCLCSCLPMSSEVGSGKWGGGRGLEEVETVGTSLTSSLLCRLLLLKLLTPKFVWSSSLDPQRPNSRF